jgi:hypothetical protein
MHETPTKKKRRHGFRNAGLTLIGIGPLVWVGLGGVMLYLFRIPIQFSGRSLTDLGLLVMRLLGAGIGLVAAFVLGAGCIALGVLFLILALIGRFIENENP